MHSVICTCILSIAFNLGIGVTAPEWCHGRGDYLQIDQKSMFDFEDTGSPQNRFCGTDLPYSEAPFSSIGYTRGCYVSDSETLLLEMKTNSDTTVGKGFKLTWEEVAPGTKCV